MRNKTHIIQFLPYFPPHKGGLETVAEEIGIHWQKQKLGKCINIITDFNQESKIKQNEKIIFQGEIIGYKKNNIENLIIPSFEIINNFPVYKVWSKKYKIIKKYLQENIGNNKKDYRIITHTRFFLTSFIGGKFARKNKIKWIHIEHGSDYVKLSSWLKTKISYFYDRIIGKWIFKKADRVLAISNVCKNFIEKNFVKRKVEVFYRGMDIPDNIRIVEDLKDKYKNKIIIGYVGRLYKWKNVSSLIQAFYSLDIVIQNNLQLVIVGDGEDFENIQKLDIKNKVYFTGGKSFEEALSYQKQFDIHIHPSSPGGGLATTLLQAMNFGCFIIATPNEGAKEVIMNGRNGVLLKNDSFEKIKNGIEFAIEKYDNKEKFAKINKEIIQNKFSWENNILQLNTFLK